VKTMMEHRKSHLTTHGCTCGRDFVSEVRLIQHLDDYPAKIDGLMCDFCPAQNPDPAWAYPCGDSVGVLAEVEVGTGRVTDAARWGSRGAWLACDPCSTLIESGDAEGLILRTLGYKALPQNAVAFALRDAVAELHGAFREQRRGPRRAWG
jgi:hypothetical protein